jgi:apolipoprotein D and lipocalin family protein
LSLVLLARGFVAAAQDAPVAMRAHAALQPIPSLDLPRYMGRWYEVAKFPNRFQKQCVDNASAEYRLEPNGQVSVLNRCQIASGAVQEAVGAARQRGAGNSPKLEVRFAPAWLAAFSAVWGSYWIIDLDANYELAAVSEPSREYLWILSRTPQIDHARYTALLERLRDKGLDVHRLERSLQR